MTTLKKSGVIKQAIFGIFLGLSTGGTSEISYMHIGGWDDNYVLR